MDDLAARVCRFTAAQLWTPRGGISPATRISADIGADGEDARAFLEAFCREFDVDATAFRFDDYFGPEAFDPFREILRRIRRGRPRKTLTVADLIAAAATGVLR